jgi:hypothetical protein
MTYSFDMTISRTEFLRLLPEATGETAVEGADGLFTSGGQGTPWRMKLSPLEPFRLGPMVLERHRLDLDLTGCSPAEEALFLERFWRHFQRGGG